jgi:hypothetical protein
MIERIKHSTGLLVVVLLVVGFYALSLVVVSYAQATDELYTSVTIQSAAPTVTNVTLNNGGAITLTEGTTTSVTCSGTISAGGGYWDVTNVTSTIYRSGVGAACTDEDNDCYQMTLTSCVTSSGSGTDMHVVCTDYLWFHADSTDASSSWPATGWQCKITATTPGGNGDGTSAAQTLNSLAAESLAPQLIPYGNRAPNSAYTVGARVTTTLYTTGNIIINTLLKGSNMSGPGTAIAPNNQHYVTSSDWTNQTTLNADQVTNNLLLLGQTVKPTSHAATSNVYTAIGWGLDVPNAQTPGLYTGTNTSTAISAI